MVQIMRIYKPFSIEHLYLVLVKTSIDLLGKLIDFYGTLQQFLF